MAPAAAAQIWRDFSTEELRGHARALAHPALRPAYELVNAGQFETVANRFEARPARRGEVPPATDLSGGRRS